MSLSKLCVTFKFCVMLHKTRVPTQTAGDSGLDLHWIWTAVSWSSTDLVWILF